MSKRILVLDDGETWELLTEDARTLIVEVSDAELEELNTGSPVDVVLGGRTGTLLVSMLIPHK